MSCKYACCLALIAMATPPATAATVFWPFGFYFPDKAHHRAGGFGDAGRPTKLAAHDPSRRSLPEGRPVGSIGTGHANATDRAYPEAATLPG